MPPKKKLSKKEKARLEAEQAEQLRIELEREKLKKLEEARQRRKIEREEAKHRLQMEIQENRQRKAQLKSSMIFFNQIREEIDIIKGKASDQVDWEKFMRCNGLPNANSPSDLRKYIHQWKMDVERRNRYSRNWLLKTNERTLLTQDSTIEDLTKASLRKQQGNLGDVYAQRVKEILGILLELDDSLADKSKPSSTLVDLNRLKTEIQILLREYLDDFTYKVMSQIERDMEVDRPGVSKHIYDSEVYKCFIWTFSKDAQLSLSAKPRIGEQNPHNEIEFPLMDMQLSLPPSVSLYSSALRGLWLNYDHLSGYCPSFNLKKPRPQHINMLTLAKQEWRKRKEILQNMLDECSKEIPIEELEQFDQERDSGTQRTREKNLDVDKLYLDYEEELNKLRRKAIGPDGFGLLETDVNLRKYRIIGGVYCLDYLEIPQQDKQLNARSFIRTILAPNKLTHKIYYQTYKPPPVPLPGVRRLPEEIEAEMRMVEAALDKLALVTVDLPNSVIWFEPPIACRWETQAETVESDLLEGPKEPTNLSNNVSTADATPLSSTTNASPLKNLSPRFTLSKSRKKSPQKSRSSNNLLVKEINDFDMSNIPKDVDIYGLIEDFIAPRLPQGFSVRLDTHKLRKVLHKWRKGHVKPGDEHIERKSRILYLARPKNILKATPASSSTSEQEKTVIVVVEGNKNEQVGKTIHAHSLSKPLEQKRLTEDFLDFNEPKEFFPCAQLQKVLKIKSHASVEFAEKPIVDILDLKKRRTSEALSKAPDKGQTVSRNDSNGSVGSVKSSKRGQSNSSGSKTSRCSSQQSEEKEEESKKETYMFSQFIEDLDRLCELQMPLEHEGESKQTISGNLIGNGSINVSEPSAGEGVVGTADGGILPSQTATSMNSAAALACFSGVSVVRDLEALKAHVETEDEEDDLVDDESSSENEYDDDDDEGHFLHDSINSSSNTNCDLTMTTNDYLTYRSEVSGSSAGDGARCEESLGGFLNKQNDANGKKSKLPSETTFAEGKWSTRDVHDTKFNEDKLSIQFRTGRLGKIAIVDGSIWLWL